MMRVENIHVGEQVFLDPMTQVSVYDCVMQANQIPAACHYIPETDTSAGFMEQHKAYNDIMTPYFLKTYDFTRADYEGQGSYMLMLTEPVQFNLAFDLQKRMTEGRRYTEEEIKIIVKICIEGVAVLWKSTQLTNRGHGNLTPSSVFMTKEGTYKLGNFNTALAFKKEQTPYASYLHPLTGKGELGIVEADLFAIGMLIYQLSALDSQSVPNVQESPMRKRNMWRSFQYTEPRLEEIWMELIERSRNILAYERIKKLSNLAQSFPTSPSKAVNSQLPRNTQHLANPQQRHSEHSHASSSSAQAAHSVLAAEVPQQYSYPQTSSQSSSSVTAPIAPPRDLQLPSLISQLAHWELNIRTPHWSRPSY